MYIPFNSLILWEWPTGSIFCQCLFKKLLIGLIKIGWNFYDISEILVVWRKLVKMSWKEAVLIWQALSLCHCQSQYNQSSVSTGSTSADSTICSLKLLKN